MTRQNRLLLAGAMLLGVAALGLTLIWIGGDDSPDADLELVSPSPTAAAPSDTSDETTPTSGPTCVAPAVMHVQLGSGSQLDCGVTWQHPDSATITATASQAGDPQAEAERYGLDRVRLRDRSDDAVTFDVQPAGSTSSVLITFTPPLTETAMTAFALGVAEEATLTDPQRLLLATLTEQTCCGPDLPAEVAISETESLRFAAGPSDPRSLLLDAVALPLAPDGPATLVGWLGTVDSGVRAAGFACGGTLLLVDEDDRSSADWLDRVDELLPVLRAGLPCQLTGLTPVDCLGLDDDPVACTE
ncbi:MAG: hypothetical protein QNJ12_21755 [Ilumatobacter sp.]|uniref:hypothetical protein n=1 Tax=Ilumatobacter sp. TaxID=1967498 RepID=UPI002627653F|nr:hypothetical protein [Ilumatobacter sp.]MDJ0771427.1 hypothetical protein [Ilumatobacter sp.]